MSNLNILDEKGQVIGQASREEVHQKGLLHAEVHVWFYTPKQALIFQRRSRTKDTYPNLLDATVGGHVEIGETYEDAAVKETKEETGISLNFSDIVFVQMVRKTVFDPVLNKTNNVLRKVFAYYYQGYANDLHVESRDGAGFESWSLKQLFALSPKAKEQFIPSLIDEESLAMYRRIEKLFIR